MTGEQAWFAGGGGPAVRRVASAEAAVAAGRAAGWRVVRLTLTEPCDKAALLRTAQQAFALPDWFGHNWDALADCLRDVVPGAGEHGVLVVWSGSGYAQPGDRATTLDILTERARQRGAGFRIALAGD